MLWCLTLSTFIASIRDFVDLHTDDATLKQWIIKDFGGNFSFASSPQHLCFCYQLPAHFRTSSMTNNDNLARNLNYHLPSFTWLKLLTNVMCTGSSQYTAPNPSSYLKTVCNICVSFSFILFENSLLIKLSMSCHYF